MLTKDDFLRAVDATIDAYPTVAPLYHAGDPRVRQNIEAMATMLAMFSAQVETAQAEVFDKVRDGTVMADAAFRGIVRRGKPTRARIKAINKGVFTATIESGRTLIDADGLYWQAETPLTLAPENEGTFEASQVRYEVIEHEVKESAPFYAIHVPESEDGAFVASIALSDADGDYEFRDRYTNTLPGERVFHVEADDRQRIFARLGFAGVVGTQPEQGHKLELRVGYTNGRIATQLGAPFSFEYILYLAGADVELSLDSLITEGENPISMGVLRELAKYPSVYRRNAVFLGEFCFLVRTHYPTAQFISVWNEALEEQARGASVDNVNTLFVACLSESGEETVLTDAEGEGITRPQEIFSPEWTKTQKGIFEAIQAADDSYHVRFFTPVIQKIKIKIDARIPSSYLPLDVKAKITEAILDKYGKASTAARRGQLRPLYRDIYALLKQKIVALSDGDADLQVSIIDDGDSAVRPELWRYVDAESLSVTVTASNAVTHSWGG